MRRCGPPAASSYWQAGIGLRPLRPARQACRWRAADLESPREAWPGREKAQTPPALRAFKDRAGPQSMPTNPRFPVAAGRDPRGIPSNSRSSGLERSRPVPQGVGTVWLAEFALPPSLPIFWGWGEVKDRVKWCRAAEVTGLGGGDFGHVAGPSLRGTPEVGPLGWSVVVLR